jgi:rhamnosyltransferase
LIKSNNKTILISVVIPVKNGISTLKDCLDAIQSQTLISQTEIIIIDSGSTDGSISLTKEYTNIQLYEIPSESFNHGATRNFGVSLAHGEFVVMTVQDAIPVNNIWLETMLVHFEDKEVAGVCGQQIVPHHRDKNPHEWFRPQSEPNVKSVQFNHGEFEKLPVEQQRSNCRWDDVNAMYRKSALLALPFGSVMFGEDMLWAKAALLKGFKLVYDTNSKVEHYHYHTPEFTYKRSMIVRLFVYKTFGNINSTRYKLIDFLLVIYRNIKWRIPMRWIGHNWSLLYTQNRARNDFNKCLKRK